LLASKLFSTKDYTGFVTKASRLRITSFFRSPPAPWIADLLGFQKA
jgi:hypothetical protein